MKKFMIFVAMLAVSVSLSAQQKGDFTVGGSLGVSGGSSSSAYSYGGSTDKTTAPNTTNFLLAPEFGWFVIDNLELAVGLEYGLTKDVYEILDDNNLFSFTHIALATVGAHYYVNLAGGKLFYTPGIKLGFGGGKYSAQESKSNSVSTSIPFALGVNFNLGKFEFKPLDYLGITLNVLDLGVAYMSVDTGSSEVKASATTFTAGLNYGMSAGVKYYF